jgi:hypothetical protein
MRHPVDQMGGRRKHLFAFWIMLPIIFCIFTSLAAIPVAAAPYQLTEEQVKAAFIFNFLKFVTWPPDKRSLPQLRLCALGNSKVAALLKSFDGKQIRGQTLRISTSPELRWQDNCHAIFLSSEADKDAWRSVNPKLQQNNVLTISDSPGFSSRDGMIELIKVDKKIRFKINLAAAYAANLKISSKLLKLARAVLE